MNIAKRDQRMTRLILFFLVLLTIALLSLSSYVDTGAIPQPTATPQNENHCMMLTDGMCYIIFPDGCQVGEPVIFGSESAGVPVTCGTVKGE